MPITPEDRARQNIDQLLTEAGWLVQDKRAANLSVGRGVAVGEFPLKSGYGEADYLLFFDGSPIGVVEAKQEGTTLTGVELQTTKYSEGVPENLPTPRRPLPFQYQSTGLETRFTNLLEPEARSRSVFSFHRPETLDQWLGVMDQRRFGLAASLQLKAVQGRQHATWGVCKVQVKRYERPAQCRKDF